MYLCICITFWPTCKMPLQWNVENIEVEKKRQLSKNSSHVRLISEWKWICSRAENREERERERWREIGTFSCDQYLNKPHTTYCISIECNIYRRSEWTLTQIAIKIFRKLHILNVVLLCRCSRCCCHGRQSNALLSLSFLSHLFSPLPIFLSLNVRSNDEILRIGVDAVIWLNATFN